MTEQGAGGDSNHITIVKSYERWKFAESHDRQRREGTQHMKKKILQDSGIHC